MTPDAAIPELQYSAIKRILLSVIMQYICSCSSIAIDNCMPYMCNATMLSFA